MPLPPPPGVDPRDIITPDAFVVAPELLGLPLARPWRRAAAVAIDAVLVWILSNLVGMLFAIAAAWVLFRASGKRNPGGAPRPVRRNLLRLAAAGIVFSLALSAYGKLFDDDEGDGGDEQVVAAVPGVRGSGGGEIDLSGREGIALAGEMLALRGSDSGEEAHDRAREAADHMREQGFDEEEIGGMMLAAVSEAGDEVEGAVQAVADSLARIAAEQPREDSTHSPPALARSYADATEGGDTVRASALRGELIGTLAADSLARLERRAERLDERVDNLRSELAEAREGRGILALLRESADELGLGFGWTALYFTAFLVLWRGQTPGKRLLHIRVLRLDGKPIGWWCAFERFGGYVAGVFTGLLDYFLLVKDRNRQALHDKIVDTVVVWEAAGR